MTFPCVMSPLVFNAALCHRVVVLLAGSVPHYNMDGDDWSPGVWLRYFDDITSVAMLRTCSVRFWRFCLVAPGLCRLHQDFLARWNLYERHLNGLDFSSDDERRWEHDALVYDTDGSAFGLPRAAAESDISSEW